MKTFTFFVTLFLLSVCTLAQTRLIVKATKPQLDAIGIQATETSVPGWSVFSTTDTVGTLSKLKAAGLYVEIDRKVELYRAFLKMNGTANQVPLPWWWTANGGMWNGSFSDAWRITKGSSKVKVGLIDTGSPLKDGEWTNPGLDSNRCIVGPSFVDGTQIYIDSDWVNTDNNGHSTHVAGIMGGEPNDSVGFQGIDQYCRIEFLKAFTLYGFGYNSAIGNAIYRGARDSCQILNMSFGSPWFSRMIQDAMWYAVHHGILCVVAAGNDGSEDQSFPAFFNHFTTSDTAMPGVISVGSIDENGNISGFSSRGFFVDIYAPGGSGMSWPADSTDILSTWPTYWVTNDDTTNGKPLTTGYNYLAGTSMAAPMVVGTASLMLAANPSLTAVDLKRIICETADTLMTVDGAYPVLNPSRAVKAAAEFTTTAVASVRAETPKMYNLAQNYPNPFNPTTKIQFSLPKSEHAALKVYNTLGQAVVTLFDGAATAGSHEFTFDGSRLASGVYFYALETAGTKIVKKMLLVK